MANAIAIITGALCAIVAVFLISWSHLWGDVPWTLKVGLSLPFILIAAGLLSAATGKDDEL